MKTTAKSIYRFSYLFKNKECIIKYPCSNNSAFYFTELCTFYNIKYYHIKQIKQVDYIHRNISKEKLIILKKTYIDGNVLSDATVYIYAKTIIKGQIFGKIFEDKNGLLICL